MINIRKHFKQKATCIQQLKLLTESKTFPLHPNFLHSYTVKKTATFNMVYDTKPPYDEQSGDISVTEVSFVYPGEYDYTTTRNHDLSEKRTTEASVRRIPLQGVGASAGMTARKNDSTTPLKSEEKVMSYRTMHFLPLAFASAFTLIDNLTMQQFSNGFLNFKPETLKN